MFIKNCRFFTFHPYWTISDVCARSIKTTKPFQQCIKEQNEKKIKTNDPALFRIQPFDIVRVCNTCVCLCVSRQRSVYAQQLAPIQEVKIPTHKKNQQNYVKIKQNSSRCSHSHTRYIFTHIRNARKSTSHETSSIFHGFVGSIAFAKQTLLVCPSR